MYSLALIIFVVSEKKAFEHFPIYSNVNIDIVTIATTKMQMTTFLNLEQEKFEDSKGVIRSRK
jgi:hypothetical protein